MLAIHARASESLCRAGLLTLTDCRAYSVGNVLLQLSTFHKRKKINIVGRGDIASHWHAAYSVLIELMVIAPKSRVDAEFLPAVSQWNTASQTVRKPKTTARDAAHTFGVPIIQSWPFPEEAVQPEAGLPSTLGCQSEYVNGNTRIFIRWRIR